MAKRGRPRKKKKLQTNMQNNESMRNDATDTDEVVEKKAEKIMKKVSKKFYNPATGKYETQILINV